MKKLTESENMKLAHELKDDPITQNYFIPIYQYI